MNDSAFVFPKGVSFFGGGRFQKNKKQKWAFVLMRCRVKIHYLQQMCFRMLLLLLLFSRLEGGGGGEGGGGVF